MESILSFSISNLTRVPRKIRRSFFAKSFLTKRNGRARIVLPFFLPPLPSFLLFARRHSASAGFLRRAKLVSRTARGETTRGEYVTTIISALKWGLISFGAGGGERRRWRR